MPAKILEAHKVVGGAEGGPRNFFLSWTPTVRGPDKRGPERCANTFLVKMEPIQHDRLGRRLTVVASSPQQQQAGVRTVSWGDFDCTDFVALVTSEYALANGARSAAATGDFAQALAAVEKNGNSLALWTAIIEPCEWRVFSIAGRVLGELPLRHPLVPDPKVEIIATSPPDRLGRHVNEAISQLLGHDPVQCPHCTPP
jgi:hypothetical protein